GDGRRSESVDLADPGPDGSLRQGFPAGCQGRGGDQSCTKDQQRGHRPRDPQGATQPTPEYQPKGERDKDAGPEPGKVLQVFAYIVEGHLATARPEDRFEAADDSI